MAAEAKHIIAPYLHAATRYRLHCNVACTYDENCGKRWPSFVAENRLDETLEECEEIWNANSKRQHSDDDVSLEFRLHSHRFNLCVTNILL